MPHLYSPDQYFIRIEQRRANSRRGEKLAAIAFFTAPGHGERGLRLPISSLVVPSAARGTSFVLHHSEADKLNTRELRYS